MTFNDDSRLRGGKVKRRGRTTAIGGGAVGVGAIVVFLIAQFTGFDLSGIVGGGNGLTTIQQEGESADAAPECRTGRDANLRVECRMEGAAESLDAYWTSEARSLGISYTSPEFFLFQDSTDTSCGQASAATGPFYCPPDRAIFLDTAFYDDLQSQYGSSGGPLAQMYVVAHEWGHHVQQLQGSFANTDRSGTGASSGSVRVELQADCYAGAWVGDAATTKDANGETFFEPITRSQITDALSAASAVGDDSIQERATGRVDPDSFTHGSSEQRQRWFLRGYQQGATSCDTLSVPGSAL
ncbi:KPN_02809 family neutral zinc metallopeptidase [Curtobacterium flaccumfaciens]|uniref:KPN_02809 family neutral zinc metallopeptidase n=1 Tax=Curtobacterium flaccumfaciens TaxID=2035 RepID=UPI001599B633|nr:neutral zinc metallopeptidase [Curtobacterium flaccumfaciens]MBT1605937.1 neutral zinc metallopeptidase [Curtobacterium flaccumfaciens pv. betae]MBT1632408.1 neutral zinc metallopeptidase [Curtobacterium flaccumfaciens pv. oortii]MBT1656560.1 neutral zinc metallopeptidase [Curtobacterium flaccumfaciens pv. betae]MCS0470735.1 neutral zinc metallopeptidase [Curtobacterium flaccumfaciens pv. betae]MCS0473583.1 neutral zinc metallopeptidase [Curtobacterium flaccumfaciens pv. betae]